MSKAAAKRAPKPQTEAPANDAAPNETGEPRVDATAAVELPLHLIDEDPDLNPRERADAEPLAELTASIGVSGVLQPIMVRASPEPGRFRVVMGHRRRAAALAAGLFTIPAVVRELDDDDAHEAATVENVQREDMTAMDDARAFKRMIDRRVARGMDFKDAKADVAARVGKSVRLIELRLQFLDMPAIKQVELAERKITAKEATEWIRKQPRPLDLTPAQWLIALEVFDRQERFPRPKEWPGESTRTECSRDADGDPALKMPLTHDLLSLPSELYEDGRTGRRQIGFHAYAEHHLQKRFGDDFNSAKARAGYLAALRAEAGIEGKFKAGQYATTWLNGPFAVPQDVLDEIAAERADAQVRREARERQIDEEAAEREAARAELAAQMGEPGKAFLAAVRVFEDDARFLTPGDFAARFRAVWLDHAKVEGPWALAPGADRTDATQLVDAAGVPNAAAGPALEARRRLMAIALNHAAGLMPFSGDAFPTPWSGGGEGGGDTGEPGSPEGDEDAEPFEDDEGLDDEDDSAAAGEDDEIPGFLRRLATGHEARP